MRAWTIVLVLAVQGAASHSLGAEPAYEQELTSLSQTIVTDVGKLRWSRIAVVEFTDLEGKITPSGRFLAEELTVALSRTSALQVVDRLQIRDILKAATDGSGPVDLNAVKSLRKQAGIDGLVTGTVLELQSGLRVTVKLISTKTGALVATSKITITKSGPLTTLHEEVQPSPSAPRAESPVGQVPPEAAPTPKNMALVSSGAFLFGESPTQQTITLPSFWIDIFEVTNEQYAKVRLHEYEKWRDQHPVTNVSWTQADIYCRAVGKRLPTEQEWEKAARGTDGRRYPWGNDGDVGRANGENRIKNTAPAGEYQGDVSPYQIHDMAGNVMEWTSTQDEQTAVYRGGSWASPESDLRVTTRKRLAPAFRLFDLGLRCAKDG